MAVNSLQQLFPNLDLSRILDPNYMLQYSNPDEGSGDRYLVQGADGQMYGINTQNAYNPTMLNDQGQAYGNYGGSVGVTHHYGTGDSGGGQFYEYNPSGALQGSRDYQNYTHNVRDAVGMSAMVLAPILGGAMLGAGAGAGSGTAEAGMSMGNGAFLGEGAASGVGAWDGALSAAQAGGAAAGTGAMGAGAGGGAPSAGPGSAGWGSDLGTEMGAVGGSGTPAGIGGAATSGLGSLGNLGGTGVGVKDLIGPAASLGSGIIGAHAAGNAADAQLQATREAAALNEPFRQAGIAGMNRLQDLLGLSSNTGAAGYGSMAKNFSMADYQADPGYQFRQQQGEQAIQRAASAAGRSDSGRAYKDLMNFNSGLASQEYGNAYNRYNTNRAAILNPLQSLMGAGQTASGTIGDLTVQGGNAQAAGQIGSANAISSAIGQGVGNYQQNQLLDLLKNRQSGSAYAN